MKYILSFPHHALRHFDEWAGDGVFEDAAVYAEEAGFSAFLTFDHPLPPDVWVARGGHYSFDPFVALSFAAKATTTIKLMTGVLIGAYRHPYILAKGLASLDRLSHGRVIAGMAAGYMQAEFEALGVGDKFEPRGKVLDETIEALRDALSGQTLNRVDKPYPVVGHSIRPEPAQARIPIWIGGNAPPAQRRAVAVGDGWMPVWAPAGATRYSTTTLHTLDLMAEATAAMQAQRRTLGKPPLEIACLPYQDMSQDWAAGCKALAAALPAYEAAGVGWIMITPPGKALANLRDDLQRFAGEVMG